jgi:flagellar hook assembly protein FlgD
VTITIFNALGQVVRTLSDNQAYEAGQHQVRWDATDSHGLSVASGVYIYRFKANDFMQVKRMLLIR